MDRKNFLKNACGLGICSCVGAVALTSNKAIAAEEQLTPWEKSFIKHRFAKLIDILDESLDETTKNEIIEKLGRECSLNSMAQNYKGDVEGFFSEIHRRWGENASFDRETGIIRIETPERDCVCPLIDSKKISPSVCQCSVGWQTQTYESILGKKVEAKCLESVIRGSRKCVFEVKILS